MGEYVVIPAQSSGAAPAGIQIRRDAQNEVFVDDDAFRIAAIGKAAEVFVRRIESEDHVRTELFKACFAVCGRCRPNRPCNRPRRDRLPCTW